MDEKVTETSTPTRHGPVSKSLSTGMDLGAGDSPSATQGSSHEEAYAHLEHRLSQLRLPKSVHNRGAEGGEVEVTQEEELTSSDDDDGGIEPLCSYPYGYIKRQTVYTCLTCNDPTKEDWKPAGICIGCRHACHQGHEVVSLETRRNFRCDCGNKKFPEGTACLLCPKKEELNELNIYNNNYKGTFCTCNCKESDCVEEDPLYQCVVCEDWYHASHCNAKTEGIEKNYTDLVCGNCTSKLDFLKYYEPFDPATVVDDKAIEEMMKYTDSDSEDDAENNNEVEEEASCKLQKAPTKAPYKSGQLWTLGWRGKLCRCQKCKDMYASLHVSFLLDKGDETRRYFDDEEDDTQSKICEAIQSFEEWLLLMEPSERDAMFAAGLDVVKQKMKEHFAVICEKDAADGNEESSINEFLKDDHLLDQLLQAFVEFILDVDGGTDYLLDVDALKSVINGVSGKEEQELGATATEPTQENE